MFFEHVPVELVLFFLLYGGTAAAALIASIYLFLRKGNAFATDITPPMPLRRWTATFFAFVFLSHIWWFLFYFYSNDLYSVSCVVVATIDNLGLLTSVGGMLFAMLQDRKRPVWPLVVAILPYTVLLSLNVVFPDRCFLYIAVAYFMVIFVLFSLYMVFALKQYGRWLRDNYADLEHKEVWVSQVLIIIILILFIIDGISSINIIISYIVQIICLTLLGFLLWRVETLPQLECTSDEQACSQPPSPESSQVIDTPLATEDIQKAELPTQGKQTLTIPSNIIQQLLDERCVCSQLYLQHDLTLQQLATAIGVNRFYISLFFSSHGTTYNAYINDLRINHFVCLYREAVATGKSITAQQLAYDSGYRSYSTFSLAFKQRMGQSVTTWVREADK